MTLSLVARCPATGMFGVVISSSSPAVAARCSHAAAGIGAVATQNITDPSLGPLALRLMSDGASADQAIGIITATRPHIAFRQLLAVDNQGRAAAFSGARALGVHAIATGAGVAAAGNLLAGAHVPQAMVDGFNAADGEFGERMLAALEAGAVAGGEAGPLHSAGLKLVRDVSWPIADLRIDWEDGDPVGRLRALWRVYRPQLESYVGRAIDPNAAPTFGVPGDA
jgi:uncharacterized Ntn-hydrolase superfamily protein